MGNKKKTNHKAPANRSHLLSLPTINPEFDPCILDLTPKFNNEPEGEYDLSPEIQKAGLKLRRVTDGLNPMFGIFSRSGNFEAREREKESFAL